MEDNAHLTHTLTPIRFACNVVIFSIDFMLRRLCMLGRLLAVDMMLRVIKRLQNACNDKSIDFSACSKIYVEMLRGGYFLKNFKIS